MRGTITKKTLIAHPFLITREYGLLVLICGLVGRYTTFLDLLKAKEIL
jgi:hypothetical protein